MGEAVSGRSLWRLTGKDVLSFLQGLVSNDVLPLEKAPGIVWAALLSPQGKYLADFFVIRRPDAPEGEILLDLPQALADGVIRRLTMYKLRADVQITASELKVQRGLGEPPLGALPDPRHAALGWRLYSEAEGALPVTDWDALRVELMVPEYPAELIPDDSYILEMGFERLNGVNFRKGCYVGQEVTARMKHKTELKKGLVRLSVSGTAASGTAITTADGKDAGRVGTQSGVRALAYARFDRLGDQLRADEASLATE